MSLKLWYSSASPFVRKVMVFAHETGLADQLELVEGDVWSPQSVIGKDNPLGKVPALVSKDGVFPGSFLCCDYLDSLHSGTRLIPQDPARRWPVLQLHAFADGVIEATVASVIEQMRRPKEFIYAGMLERQRAKVVATLGRLEQIVPAQAVDIGSITLGCALGYLDFRMGQLDWRAGHAKLAAWYQQFSARKSMQATVPRA